jgi:hypothetical protein
VTLAWPWAEESEGGREENMAWWLAPFEAEAREAGEGWGSGVRHRVEEKMGQREGDRGGTDVVALGGSDSGGRCTPR